MSAMDHAAAHERIEDLLLQPVRLAALQTSTDPTDVALREHVAGCQTCRADLETWQRLGFAIAEALPLGGDPADAGAIALAAVEPLELPPSMRTSVISAVRDEARAATPVLLRRRPDGRSWRRLAPWTALAAALAVMIGFSAITIDQATQRARVAAEATALADLAATVQDVLAVDHKIVPLQRPDGSTAGSISWSRHDWVVLTSALVEPPAGQRYLCWLEDGSKSVAVGSMEFAGPTAYWAAALDDWQTWEIGPETRFVVTLEAAGAPARTGQPVLEASLGS
jgi:hypothetical protein